MVVEERKNIGLNNIVQNLVLETNLILQELKMF